VRKTLCSARWYVGVEVTLGGCCALVAALITGATASPMLSCEGFPTFASRLRSRHPPGEAKPGVDQPAGKHQGRAGGRSTAGPGSCLLASRLLGKTAAESPRANFDRLLQPWAYDTAPFWLDDAI